VLFRGMQPGTIEASDAAVVGSSAPSGKRSNERTFSSRCCPTSQDNEMHVWVADIAPGAATGPHSHPTPRFVFVLEGAVF
jgi:quercetin dioxygenase-like cupin family protein